MQTNVVIFDNGTDGAKPVQGEISLTNGNLKIDLGAFEIIVNGKDVQKLYETINRPGAI